MKTIINATEARSQAIPIAFQNQLSEIERALDICREDIEKAVKKGRFSCVSDFGNVHVIKDHWLGGQTREFSKLAEAVKSALEASSFKVEVHWAGMEISW